jgi:hypothetical protein
MKKLLPGFEISLQGVSLPTTGKFFDSKGALS